MIASTFVIFGLPSALRCVRQGSGAGGGNRTHTALRPPDFESGASASSATPAWGRLYRLRDGILHKPARVFPAHAARAPSSERARIDAPRRSLMKNAFVLLAAAIVMMLGQAGLVAAQTQEPSKDASPKPDAKPAETKPPDAAAPKEESSVTDHTVRIGGQTIPY